MTAAQLEKRIAAMEAEISALKARLPTTKPISRRWYAESAGAFKDDPVFDEIVRLGRKYRESLRPKPRKRKVTK